MHYNWFISKMGSFRIFLQLLIKKWLGVCWLFVHSWSINAFVRRIIECLFTSTWSFFFHCLNFCSSLGGGGNYGLLDSGCWTSLELWGRGWWLENQSKGWILLRLKLFWDLHHRLITDHASVLLRILWVKSKDNLWPVCWFLLGEFILQFPLFR